MYPSVAQFIGFIALVIIMSSVAIALNRRIEKRRTDEQEARNAAWVQLDVRRDAGEEPLPSPEPENDPGDERADENDDQSIHTRAKQNGHYSESKKPG